MTRQADGKLLGGYPTQVRLSRDPQSRHATRHPNLVSISHGAGPQADAGPHDW